MVHRVRTVDDVTQPIRDLGLSRNVLGPTIPPSSTHVRRDTAQPEWLALSVLFIPVFHVNTQKKSPPRLTFLPNIHALTAIYLPPMFLISFLMVAVKCAIAEAYGQDSVIIITMRRTRPMRREVLNQRFKTPRGGYGDTNERIVE